MAGTLILLEITLHFIFFCQVHMHVYYYLIKNLRLISKKDIKNSVNILSE